MRSLFPLFVLVANCLFAIFLFWSAWSHPSSAWIGENHDAPVMMWYLAWTPHNLVSLPRHPLFTDFIMYPSGVNLMWNPSLVFPALLVWPITALFGPIVAFNVVATMALAVSSWAAYLVVRRYTSHELVATFAGMVYGFSPYMILQSLGHTNLTIAVFPPLVWLLLDELLVRRRWHPAVVGVLLGAACSAQVLTSLEILATTALVAAIGVGLLAMLCWRQVGTVFPRAVAGGAVALITFFVLAAYPLYTAFFGPQRVSGTLQPPNVFVADVLSFVIPPGYAYLGAVHFVDVVGPFTGNGVETGGAYLGIPGLVILALALIFGWRSSVARFAGLLTVGIMVLALGPRLHYDGHIIDVRLPWAAVQHLPLMVNALPVRLMLFAWLGVALVLGVVGSRLIESGKRGLAIAVVSAALFAAPIFPTPPLLATPAYAPQFFSPHGEVTRIPVGSVALVTPLSNQASTTAMYYQMVADFRFRMPEGLAYIPGPTFNPPPSDLQQAIGELDAGSYPGQPPAHERQQALDNLKQWKVDTIVVGPSPGEGRIVTFFTRVTGRPPQRTGGVWVWWNVRSTVLAQAGGSSG
jgi:hypothetical protein